MKIVLWGARGSIPSPRPGTLRYGGNTSCVEVCSDDPTHVVVLDAGTGVCSLGAAWDPTVSRVDVLLSHLHIDHILGLGFFSALFQAGLEVHIWGPASTTQSLRERLSRYLSPPLFPVRLRDLPCRLSLHDVPLGRFEIPGFAVRSALVCHPGPRSGTGWRTGTDRWRTSPTTNRRSVSGNSPIDRAGPPATILSPGSTS